MREPSLLARMAESLFWIGRYVERADDTSRIIDSYLHRMLEDPTENEDVACRTLLAIMGVPTDRVDKVTTPDVLELLAYDAASSSSIIGSLSRARENAQGSRDVISTEMWECLNTTWFELPARRAQVSRTGPHAFLRSVRDRSSLFAGLTDATMNRSDAWRFVTLGRGIERIDMMTRLLAVRIASGVLAPDWGTLLRAAGAEEAFRQVYPGQESTELIAGFLMLDPYFPRSALFALTSVEGDLAALSDNAIRLGSRGDAQRIIGQARTTLEYSNPDELIHRLSEILELITTACADATEAITLRYFDKATWVQWESEAE